MNLESLLPLGSDRRFLVQLLRRAIRHPRDIRHRINQENVAAWRRARRTTIRCNICGHGGTLLHEMPDLALLDRCHIGRLRETLRCRTCFSKMRDRTVAAGLLNVMAEKFHVEADTIAELAERMPSTIRVLDTDANGRLAGMLRGNPGYVLSLYRPDHANGAALSDGALNVDLEQMPFPDQHFDVIITSEVMEHVRFVDTAHKEIARCLKPDGTYLFTVPYDDSLPATWDLIDPVTDSELVHPPHIHGDPGLRDQGIKSYRVFGRDIVANLRALGLDAQFIEVNAPTTGIFSGDLFSVRHAPS